MDENIGFSFDPSTTESERSQCSAIFAEYNKVVSYGLEDPETIYPEYRKKTGLGRKKCDY